MKKIFYVFLMIILIPTMTLSAGWRMNTDGVMEPSAGADTPIKVGSVSAATAKLTTGAGAGKVLTSDADGDATWENAPSGTVPSSGTSTTAAMVGDGSGGWDVVETVPVKDSNGYLTDVQNFADIQTAGSGYWFDGVNDYIIVPDNDNIDIGVGDWSVLTTCSFNLGSAQILWGKTLGADTWEGYKTTITSANKAEILLSYNHDTNLLYKVVTEPLSGKNATFITVFDRDDDITVYENSEILPLTTLSGSMSTVYGLDIKTESDLYFGRRPDSSVTYLNGNISKCQFFNFALSDTEAKALSNGAPVPYKYIGASQTELTSGTLTIGKAYRLKDWVTNDDFTNVGAASNADGVEFVATGTTPTTWTNSSKVVRIGCVADYSPSGVGHNIWADNSGNELHGTVSGATPVNLPTNHREKYIDLAVTGDTSFTLPSGYIINAIVLTSDGAIGGGIDIGTTNGGGEVVTAEAIAGAGTVLCTLVDGAAYNTTGADDTLYITDADGTGWDSATVGVRVQMERISLN